MMFDFGIAVHYPAKNVRSIVSNVSTVSMSSGHYTRGLPETVYFRCGCVLSKDLSQTWEQAIRDPKDTLALCLAHDTWDFEISCMRRGA